MSCARASLKQIVTSLVYLAKQGMAIRGNTDSTSNFNQLLELRASDVMSLQSRLARCKYRWISHDIQNEILQILSTEVLNKILDEVKEAEWYSIMVDETNDCTNQ